MSGDAASRGGAARDRVLAAATGLFGAVYTAQARGIEDSLLSDAVGAGGVPQAVGLALMACAVALFAKTWRRAGADRADRADGADGADAADAAAEAAADADGAATADAAGASAAADVGAPRWRIAGLVVALAGYGLLLPWTGYMLTIGLLVAVVGVLAGARPGLPLAASALAAGPVLWVLFDALLQVRLPVGRLFGG